MRISQIIEFLEKTKEAEGDIKVVSVRGESITGFWIATNPHNGERVLMCSEGKGMLDAAAG